MIWINIYDSIKLMEKFSVDTVPGCDTRWLAERLTIFTIGMRALRGYNVHECTSWTSRHPCQIQRNTDSQTSGVLALSVAASRIGPDKEDGSALTSYVS